MSERPELNPQPIDAFADDPVDQFEPEADQFNTGYNPVAMGPPYAHYETLDDLERDYAELEPPPEDDQPELVVRDPILTLRSIRELREFVASQGPRLWLVRGVWPARAYGMLGGEPKAQKTWSADDLAVSVASGLPWLGHFEIDRAGTVLIFCGEGGEGAILRRLDAIATSKGVDLDDFKIIVCARVPHLSKIAHMAEFDQAIRLHHPVLVILDPLYLAAGGANLRDLYDMGAMLEIPQHLCVDQGAALLVLHHFNRAKETRGAGRFSGAGPAEWGRVLIGTSVESRHTDKITTETTVVTELEVIGGEVHDQKYRVTRKIKADDPADLDSPFIYSVSVVEADSEAEAESVPTQGESPAMKRVRAVLVASVGKPLSVQVIGDHLAKAGRPLKARTIQEALGKLGDEVDSIPVDQRGKALWKIRGAS